MNPFDPTVRFKAHTVKIDQQILMLYSHFYVIYIGLDLQLLPKLGFNGLIVHDVWGRGCFRQQTYLEESAIEIYLRISCPRFPTDNLYV